MGSLEKTENNGQSQALQAGMDIFCEGLEQISEHIRRHPDGDAFNTVSSAIQGLDERLDEVVGAVEAVVESGEAIKYQIGNVAFALEKASETLGWVRNRFPVPDSADAEPSDIPSSTHAAEPTTFHWPGQVNNVSAGSVAGNTFNSFQALYNSQNGG